MNGATLLSPFAKRRLALVTGIVGLAIFMGFLWYAFAGSGLITIGGHEVKAVFDDGLNVVPRSSEVRVNGLNAGKVTSIKLNGAKVILTLNLDDDIYVHSDAKASLMLKSILGEKYVLLVPGTSKAPLRGPIVDTAMGADVAELSAGAPNSAKLYQGLGRDAVFKGLDLASNKAPDTAQQVKDQLLKLRLKSDELVRSQANLFGMIDNLDAVSTSLVNASDSVGSLLDSKAIIQRRIERTHAKALTAFVKTDTSVQLIRAIATKHTQDVNDIIARMKVAVNNGEAAIKLFKSGRYVPAALYGLGPLLDKDNRDPGPNPQAPAPPIPLPSTQELDGK